MVQFITEHNFSLYVYFNKQAVVIKFKNLCSQLVKALLQQAGYLVQRLQQLKRCRTCTLHEYYKNQFLRYGLVITLFCEKKNDKKKVDRYLHSVIDEHLVHGLLDLVEIWPFIRAFNPAMFHEFPDLLKACYQSCDCWPK